MNHEPNSNSGDAAIAGGESLLRKYPILRGISSPEDLRKLDFGQLEALAKEIRSFLLEVVLSTGGHLAANLGAVELTIALHYVFDSPVDKLVWDVGHQCYTHKLLTGRASRFSSLRQMNGLHGFPLPEESPHDAYGTAHGSTAISAALGLAKARDLAGGKEHIVAVVGDGALTGGLAYEGLNHAGHLGTGILVVLNDNTMAISPSVGAMARYLYRVTTGAPYLRFKHDVERLMGRMPLGDLMLEGVERFKEVVKHALTPGTVFRELGFRYLGPVDGHDIRELTRILTLAKETREPVLVHVTTTKGKGYAPAEQAPSQFHGITPPSTARADIPTWTDAFGEAAVRLAEADPRVIAITAAMCEGTGLAEFERRFPDRFFDVGMAEEHAVTFAAGLATAGMRPIVAIYSTFLQRSFDQIVHDVCLQNLPVVFAVDRAGIVGGDGAGHQGVLDVAYLRLIPNMTVMAPKDEQELRDMLYTAFQLGAPASLRYPRGSAVGVPLRSEFCALPVGKAESLQEGTDLCFIALGNEVQDALAAARILGQEGLSCGVINARFAKPVDGVLFAQIASQVPLIVTVEEGGTVGGFGEAVTRCVNESEGNCCRVLSLGIPDTYLPTGSANEIRALLRLDADSIAQTARHAFEEIVSAPSGRER